MYAGLQTTNQYATLQRGGRHPAQRLAVEHALRKAARAPILERDAERVHVKTIFDGAINVFRRKPGAQHLHQFIVAVRHMHNVKVLVQRMARKYRHLSPECRLNADGRSKRHRLIYTIKQRIRRNGRFRLDQRQIATFHTAQPFNIAVDDTLQVGVHTNVQVYVGILSTCIGNDPFDARCLRLIDGVAPLIANPGKFVFG